MSPIEAKDIKNKPKPKRNRVPVSCLSCKKRKVKCDKAKPSCGGCIRNGVGHLCQYIDPPWLDKDHINNVQNGHSVCTSVVSTPINIVQTEEYKSLKSNNENIIRNQRKEIEDLKRQISVIQQLSPKDSSNNLASQVLCKRITVLNKLSPLPANKEKLEILNDFTILAPSSLSTKAQYIDTYSWINLIKLDPQLTTLWFKITNLQKIYHMYKMNILKDNTNTNTNLKPVANGATKKNFKINEIDFTYSFNSQSSPSPNQTPQPQSKCPVIECDFNFMVEDAISNASDSPFKQNINTTTPKPKEDETVQISPEYSNNSLVLQNKLIKLYEVITNITRGQKLNYKQVTFLLDYYFHSDFESKRILLFYKSEIQSILHKENDEIQLSLPQDEDNYHQLKITGMYISMLAIIVEETLDYLRNLIRNEEEDNTSYISEQFKSHFPNELVYLNLGPKQTNILYMVQDLMINFIKNETNSLSAIAIVLTLLNKEVDEYKKPGSSIIDTKSSFTLLFTNFLQMLLNKNTIEIWKDPELIDFKEFSPHQKIKKRSKHLKLQFCNLWTDIVRLTNLVTFNLVPLIDHNENLDKLLKEIYYKIQISDSLQSHLGYLTSIGENQLIISLHIHYLVASISCSLCYGIKSIGLPNLIVDNLRTLIKQCQTWSNDVGLQRINETRKIEIVTILNYLKYFMTYILMLQAEESMDLDLLQSIIPDIFIKLVQFIDQLKISGFTTNDQSQYIYLMITELLTRSIQFIIGLLMRLKDDQNNLIKQYSKNITTEFGSIDDLMNKIIQKITQEIEFLEKVLINKNKLTKLSKLWKFYLTFLQNSKQMNYAKLHAGIPEFTNTGAANKCPVLSESTTTSTNSPISIKKDFSKCPISQITTPMDDEEIKPPIKKAKKCPFDHTSMIKPNHHVFNPIESNIRQDYKTHSPSPLSMVESTPSQLQNQPVNIQQPPSAATPQLPQQLPPQQSTNFSISATNSISNELEPIEFDILNQFNDFDFNFLNNENLLEHFNMENSNSINNKYFINNRLYTTTNTNKKTSYSKYFKYGVAIGLTSTVLYYTSDRFKHEILTIDRVNTVTIAMIRCFWLYKQTLDKQYPTQKERNEELSKTHQKAANITLKALEKNGGVYIKLGQHISALTYLLPKEWTETMIPLQDKCPRSSMEEIENLFETDLGAKLNEFFSEFDPNPVGVASLAQVHIAKLKSTGEKVAVKIQHPSLKEFVPLDVKLTRMVFDLMYKVFPEYPLTWLGDEMQNSIFVELDFTKEAENSKRTAEYFKNYQKETALKIPQVINAEPRILIMEYVAGARLDDLEYMKRYHIDTSKVSSCLSHIFNNMIFIPGVGLHCDPHGGNLAIRKLDKRKNGHNFEIILYDHGLYRDIPLQMKRDYSNFWLAVLDNDVPNLRKYAEKFAGIKGEQKFLIFMSAITGRSPENAINYNIKTRRSENEINEIQSTLNEEKGVLEDLMEILSSMPRIVLLILKTNDLTRNLDENLKSSLGPERTFLIMANYCAASVYDENKEYINKTYKGISWLLHQFSNWWQYQKRLSQLYIYDASLMFKRWFI
ncbi:unnamed protein product [Candida verbasci]|uniref:Zn(2)-C6 fungal-type domain-containing protein n=1 Tax=Candida verbasci TaxID=1227364 RepID=A0A9W4U1M2_9ASCO|nr:unnamed protein product [Candida verbasci]